MGGRFCREVNIARNSTANIVSAFSCHTRLIRKMNSYTEIAHVLFQCEQGDRTAIEALISHFRPEVYRFALSILRDTAEADEATQDVFVAIIGNLDTYRGGASFRTWLFTITLNICRGRLRKRRVQQRLQQVLLAIFRQGYQESAHLEQVVLRNEADASVWRAINALDTECREVLILRYYHELSLSEIARIVGRSERTIRARLHRAREQLRVLLSKEAGAK